MTEKQLNDIVQFLQEKEKYFIKDVNLIFMIKAGYPLEIIELIIKMGKNVYEDYEDRDIFQAIVNRKYNIVGTMELLKKYGIKFNNRYASEALYDFVEQEKLEEAMYLIDNEVDVHWKDNAIIKLALSKAQKDEMYYEFLKVLFNAKTY